ncbi:hypothetical protein EV126DRAFT_43302 [Verticillium dahliae]|nr:hypothetical protein EV126DRAFT_43302 [Verticillium dahliae]
MPSAWKTAMTAVLEMRTDMILLSSQIYFTARSTNAIRAGRTRLEAISCDTFKRCYETCPFCHEVFQRVHRFLRHGCKYDRDQPGAIFMRQRISHFNGVITGELNRLQSLPRVDSKRPRESTVSSPLRPRKMAKKSSSLPRVSDVYCDTSYPPCDPTTTDDGMEAIAREVEISTWSQTRRVDDQQTAIMGLKDNSLACLTEPDADGEWAFADTVAPTSPKDWTLAQTIANMTANDGEWAFANMGVGRYMIEGDNCWTMPQAVPNITIDGGSLAGSATVTNSLFGLTRGEWTTGAEPPG